VGGSLSLGQDATEDNHTRQAGSLLEVDRHCTVHQLAAEAVIFVFVTSLRHHWDAKNLHQCPTPPHGSIKVAQIWYCSP
jgi:hypothetical protein